VGCASFPKKELLTVNLLPDVSKFNKKPFVYFDIGVYDQKMGKRYKPGSSLQPYARNFQRIVYKITNENNLFTSFTFDDSYSQKSDYSIVMTLTFYGADDFTIRGLGAAITLCLIPVPAYLDLVLKADIFDCTGKNIKSYTLKDGTKTWFHLFMLPAFFKGNKQEQACDKTVINMVKYLYQRILEENILQYN
jgi:hypothetical protein